MNHNNTKSFLGSIKGGFIFTFVVSSIFAILDFILYQGVPGGHGQPIISILGFGASIVVPAMMVIFLDSLLIITILDLGRERVHNMFALLLGLLVGVVTALIQNYLIWSNYIPIARSAWFPTFWDFLVKSYYDFFWYAFFINRSFLPSVVSIMASMYLGWKINNVKIAKNIN